MFWYCAFNDDLLSAFKEASFICQSYFKSLRKDLQCSFGGFFEGGIKCNKPNDISYSKVKKSSAHRPVTFVQACTSIVQCIMIQFNNIQDLLPTAEWYTFSLSCLNIFVHVQCTLH